MIPQDRAWHRVDGASLESLAALRRVADVELPESFYAFLAYSNGGEGPLETQPLYFCLDAAEQTADAIVRRSHEEFFPGLVVFGSDGAGELIAFDTRTGAPWPVVSLDMTNIDLTESVRPIASDFDQFVRLIGR